MICGIRTMVIVRFVGCGLVFIRPRKRANFFLIQLILAIVSVCRDSNYSLDRIGGCGNMCVWDEIVSSRCKE